MLPYSLMDYSYLNDILILFATAVAVVVCFLRLNLPPILGYLFVGAVVGPFGLGWIDDTELTRAFAEFGVVFLLFTIGLEFSLPQLVRMKGAVLGLGAFQVLITTMITAVIAFHYFDFSLTGALVLGGVVAMSSTALVIRQLTEQVELHSRHGRNVVGILLFQDLAVIPFLILAAMPVQSSGDMPVMTIVIALVKGVVVLGLILAIGHWVLRPLFRVIARYRSHELFTLTALMIAMGASGLTHEIGLSLALGGFLAGMMLGETEFRHQIEAEIRPFRDVLLALFFITIGMLLNVQLLSTIWPWVLCLLAALMIGKLLIVAGLCRLGGWDSAVSLRSAWVLAHGGEFGFAILALALSNQIFPENVGQTVLAAILISMAVAPLMIRSNQSLTSILLPAKLRQSKKSMKAQVANTAEGLTRHVIICGYGRVGQNVAHMLDFEFIKYVALDLDPVLVQNAMSAKEPVVYGDSANIELLDAAGLSRAAALVISLNDIDTAIKILHKVRAINSEIPILVRAADDTKLKVLQDAGATEVVPETLEASLMLSSHLLITLNIPPMMVFARIRQIRRERYALLRQLFAGEDATTATVESGGEQLHAVELTADAWPVQRTIAELGLEESGITLTAIQRQKERLINPDTDTVLLVGDTLILFGAPAALEQIETDLLQTSH